MQISNFIYSKEGALSHEACDSLMQEADKLFAISSRDEDFGFGDTQFPVGKLGRHDFQVFMPSQTVLRLDEINDCIFSGLDEYRNVIASVKSIIVHSPQAKLQYTPVGGGFHEWHCEQGGGQSASRALVWMIYLNDVTDGGDTEFLYQQMKIQPKKGTLVIWPAGITHPHRGNPPYSNDKYVVTGWFVLPPDDSSQAAFECLAQSSDKKGVA